MLIDLFSLLVLGPILAVQGIYTRKVTPKLEEPAGARSGIVGRGKSIRLMVLGDSAAAGVGVAHQADALSGQLVSKLAEQYEVDWRLEAETGLKTVDMLERLRSLEAFSVDVVIVSLGVNDVTGFVSTKQWLQQQKQVRDLLTGKFEAKRILFTNVPPMHEFPALPQPLRWFLGRRAKSFNRLIEQELVNIPELEIMKVKFPMRGDYFATDGFHPGSKAYAFWANFVMRQIVREFSD